ncbi:unnamed protein product [Cuscuta epithymum]|uniref:MULE transposase domain-containing protein n=1 Tax=Cuscuta epithymum TaxID=186058 RepID=A0AAV0E312_9ASTE|nr:unnamed protein product [Cuscuta epithymum]
MFYSKFQTTEDGKLKHLFWADGRSRSDFQCFGDVLAFDTTYKKNKYNKPLVIFSGCNHHSQTTIFGCALLGDETIETYKWVLEAFLDAMHNKHPISVVTDGDGAMRDAIKQVFPNASHRLCAWHLHKNACENVKKSDFLTDFMKAMYYNFSPDEFEEYWKQIVSKHNLVGNKWVTKTYEIKHMWATAYFRDKFFGRIRTTSQCEAINALIKRYVRRKSSIFEFTHSFERAVREYRNNEREADFNDSFAEPVLTTSLHKFEHEASKLYTLHIFKEVREELLIAGSLNVIERVEVGDKLLFKMKKYSNPGKEHNVVSDALKTNLSCEFHLYESRGIPCAHIFAVMKYEFMDSIPISLVCKRWTKTAKSELVCSDNLDEIDSDVMKSARFGSVAALAHKLCDIASNKRGLFLNITNDLLSLIHKYETVPDNCSKDKSCLNHIGDPTIVKTKGAPKKIGFGRKNRRCRSCNSFGHTAKNCAKLLATYDKKGGDHNELSSSEEKDEGTPEGIYEEARHEISNSIVVPTASKRKQKEKQLVKNKLSKKAKCPAPIYEKDDKMKLNEKEGGSKMIDKQMKYSTSTSVQAENKTLNGAVPMTPRQLVFPPVPEFSMNFMTHNQEVPIVPGYVQFPSYAQLPPGYGQSSSYAQLPHSVAAPQPTQSLYGVLWNNLVHPTDYRS